MATLLSRADQAVSISVMIRGAKKCIDDLVTGVQDRYVVMRNNAPAVVMLSVESYQAMAEELEDLRLERIAAERLRRLEQGDAELIDGENVLARYGLDHRSMHGNNEKLEDTFPKGSD